MRRRIEPPFLVGVAEAPQNRQAKRALLFDREFAPQTGVVDGVLRSATAAISGTIASFSAAKMRRTSAVGIPRS